MDSKELKGVFSPVVTPFTKDYAPDADRLIAHCRWLLSNDVGLAMFGTNSEANSLSVVERIDLLESIVGAGLDPARMMPGTGCCSLSDSVELTKKAVDLGCGGVLMLPPFFYKGVSDDGLYRNYAEIIERVGDARLRIYLYHIPQVSGVAITFPLIERLLKDYPGVVAGAKDSSGDWANTEGLLTEFAPEGFRVFPGSESFLLKAMRGGGAGCISATANVNPGPIARLAATWQQDDADAQQAALDEVRNIFQGYVMIPALKAAVAHYGGDPAWLTVRPPLDAMSVDEAAQLAERLDKVGFAMPGLQ